MGRAVASMVALAGSAAVTGYSASVAVGEGAYGAIEVGAFALVVSGVGTVCSLLWAQLVVYSLSALRRPRDQG